MIVFDQFTQPMTFELEILRHTEMIPSDRMRIKGETAPLSFKYSSPLDLIRRTPIDALLVDASQVFRSDNLKYSKQVLWSQPFIAYNDILKRTYNISDTGGNHKQQVA